MAYAVLLTFCGICIWVVSANRLPTDDYSTVTDFARLRGWSTSVPFDTAA